jgi:hypothetical protein
MHNARNGGYIGLVMLLVSVAIIGFLFLRTYLTPTPVPVVEERSGDLTTTTTDAIDAYHADIDSATKIRAAANQYDKALNSSLGQ